MSQNRKKLLALGWIAVVLLIASAICRFVPVCNNSTRFWAEAVLPMAAALLFAAVVLISGKEMFYKTMETLKESMYPRHRYFNLPQGLDRPRDRLAQ